MREQARDPWLKITDISLVADQRLVVRNDGPGESYTFHPLGLQRFLVQALMKEYYAYGVLEIRNGEGFLSMMLCDNINQRAFKAAGGTINQGLPVTWVTCELDSAANFSAVTDLPPSQADSEQFRSAQGPAVRSVVS
jgi:hypothetical protein